jgi:hypothetical protein
MIRPSAAGQQKTLKHFEGGDVNLYRYVGNSPANATETLPAWRKNLFRDDPLAQQASAC